MSKLTTLHQQLVELEEARRLQAQRQDRLFRLGAALATALDEAEICQRVVEGLKDDALGYAYVGMFLVDERLGDRVERANAGLPSQSSPLRLGSKQGLSEKAFLDGRLHYTPDVTRADNYVFRLGSGAEVDIPVKIGEEVVGVLVVESRQPNAFDEEDFHLLSAAATQAGFALGWARSLGETQQRVAELATINYISQALVSQLDLEALFELTGEQVRQNFAANIVHVALYDAQSGLIHFPYKFDRGQRLTNEPIRYGQRLISNIIKSGQPLLINSNLQQYKADLGLEAWDDLPAKSYLGVPITVNDPTTGQAVIGALTVQSTEREDYFEEADLRLLVTIAAHVGVAIQNARLYAQTRQAREAAEAVNRELSQTLQDLRAAQAQLVEAEKMAALGGLVAGVAHEINTPIGVGVTAASLLAEKTEALAQTFRQGQMKRSDLEKYLDLASQSSEMLLSNLNRAADLIQSFKQVAVDQSSEERRTFPVKAYLEEILLSLRPQLKRTKLTIKINGDDDLRLDSYPGAFAQIVTNLVMNSLMHAYDPDDTGCLFFEVKRKGSRFIFKYSDDGKGIAQENLNKIFEPFFTTRRGRGGSGLGLHIIYNLVHQKFGGVIKCESEVGIGTKFKIEMPLEPPKI